MDDFDVFTNEIDFSKPFYMNLLKKFISEGSTMPNGFHYQYSHKLQALEYLADNEDLAATFHLSESMAAQLRTIAEYRHDQIKSTGDNVYKVAVNISLKDTDSKTGKSPSSLPFKLPTPESEIESLLQECKLNKNEPLHIRYLKFSSDNNIDNFKSILNELPKEWTIIQLTAPYNPHVNLKNLDEYKTDIDMIYLSLLTNDYLKDYGPFTVQIPANLVKEGEKPLFKELYSILDDNYKTIENAQFLNNKRLVQNYWNRREDIDLRMKSVIMVMDREWLGGYSGLLSGKLVDSELRDRVRKLVDDAIADWGLVRLTQKQKILLYNLLESSPDLSSTQIKSGIRKILTEHGNPDDIRQVIDTIKCENCTTEFDFVTELCLKCLSSCFHAIHHFTLVEGLRAFSNVATQLKENEEWATLKKAARHPVILILDELLDTFPWECLPILNIHPVSRMESIHFIYYLYKSLQDHIKDGYFMSKAIDGKYIINPEKNLDRMEKRMSSFVQYWCPRWSGQIRETSDTDLLARYLSDADIFLYCGHGDGGAGRVSRDSTSSAVLAGCGSVRLRRGQLARLADSPLVVGMLWEVTDLEVDKVVTSLLALCVPSDAPVPWENVGKANWSKGVLDTNVEVKSKPTPERNLLSAVAKARRSTNFVMIASSTVVRGIPVMIEDGK